MTSSRISQTSGRFLLDQLLRLLDGRGVTLGVETGVDEGLEQFERHLLRQAALVQLELRTGHDDRAAGIVDALAEQVLTEPALLALEHVGQRLQRTLVGAGDDAAATAVVEQRIDGFLQHALFVAHDDAGSAQLDQPLQTVVAVDDAAIEVVQIRRGETAAVQRDERAQVRRDHRTTFMIIHSGRLPDSMKFSTTLSRFRYFFCFSSEVVEASSERRSPAIFSRSMPARRS
jgi:hypothetical protein